MLLIILNGPPRNTIPPKTNEIPHGGVFFERTEHGRCKLSKFDSARAMLRTLVQPSHLFCNISR